MNVKARFKCIEIRHVAGAQPNACLAELKFMAAYNDGKGNEDWSKWTPSGEIKMMVTNPRAIEAFELGKEYELTFAPTSTLPAITAPRGWTGQ